MSYFVLYLYFSGEYFKSSGVINLCHVCFFPTLWQAFDFGDSFTLACVYGFLILNLHFQQHCSLMKPNCQLY